MNEGLVALQRSGPDPEALVAVATGLRLRGAGGRLTATLVPGGVDQLEGRKWLLVGRSGGDRRRFGIEQYSIYRNKVILKLEGVDTAAQAEPLRGQDILLPCNGLVDLPEGAYYIFELVGLRVQTRDGREIGTVRSVVQTGGTPLLAIEARTRPVGAREGREILLPAARSICVVIDRTSGSLTIDPPEGLLELYEL